MARTPRRALPQAMAVILRRNRIHNQGNAVHTLYGETMGTRWRVCALASAHADLNVMHAGIQAQLDRVVAQMSTWEPDSDISRFNQAAAGSWHALPPAFFDVLRCALDIAEASDGAFDPTLGALVELWGFGAGSRRHRPPSAQQVAALHARSGWQRIALHATARTALQPGGVALDLSAIAKGYGVDAVAAHLRGCGISGALVDVGGELYGYGRTADGTPWRVLVEAAPGNENDPPCVLALEDCAVATSGDRWHRFAASGRLYAHTLDPRSGAPLLDAPAAVTVIADDAMHADAWATALTVMGMEHGHAFAQARGFAARFVTRTADGFATRATRAFEQRLVA